VGTKSRTTVLPEDWKTVVSVTLQAVNEKCFFHWELEFPEVFYGPRPGTTQVTERLEGAGFDAVIGNPPYDEPSQYYSSTTEDEKTFLSEYSSYSRFKNGRVNLYRLFIVRGLEQVRKNGKLAYIVPMSLLADDFSLPIREYVLRENGLTTIEAFPQKDDPRRRVFPEAKLSTCIVVIRSSVVDTKLTVSTHPGRYFEANSPQYQTTTEELSHIFKHHIAVPTVSEEEWAVLQHAFARANWPTLGELAQVYVGEIFDNAPNKRFLSDEPVGPLVLRGANIDRYLLREYPTQGKNRYLRESLFRKEKKRAVKLDFLNEKRIGLQRGAAVDNWRRLIACPIPAGAFSFDTVLLILPKSIDSLVLLGLINSDLWEWRFRCTSTTNHVNEYELIDLIIPPRLIDENTYEHKCLRSWVEAILEPPELVVRRSDCQVISPTSIDFQIDELIFQVYSLRNEDIEVIRNSLKR
jgi:Eco57I restriction-modification methylase